MDPLSATASVIALLQAAAAIGKGIETLRSLGKAPAEFCALLNEVDFLESHTKYVYHADLRFESLRLCSLLHLSFKMTNSVLRTRQFCLS